MKNKRPFYILILLALIYNLWSMGQQKNENSQNPKVFEPTFNKKS